MEKEEQKTEKQITFTQHVLGFFRFGHEIKISPKSNACFIKAGYNIHYHVDAISVTIGIGDDHTAELSMTKDAWNALRDGCDINITTSKEFKNNTPIA